MGDPVEPEADLFVQVFSYEQTVAAGDGSTIAAVDIEVCTTAPRDDGREIDASAFELVMPDASRRVATSTAVEQPALTVATFASGTGCVRGFVTFVVPLGITPRFVELTAARPAIRWTIGAEIEDGH
jgi:hypothetical protein